MRSAICLYISFLLFSCPPDPSDSLKLFAFLSCFFLFLLNLFFFYFILEKTFVSCSTCWTLECARKTQPAVQNRTFRSVQIKEKPTFPFNKCRLAYTVKFMGIYRPIGSINREPIPFCHFARIDEWRIENPIKLNNVWRNLVPLRVAAVI